MKKREEWEERRVGDRASPKEDDPSPISTPDTSVHDKLDLIMDKLENRIFVTCPYCKRYTKPVGGNYDFKPGVVSLIPLM